MAHALDHLVLPVSNLAAARTRLTMLGFTVAPDAVHPFGTANACVFLPDGTYLEPLAEHDREAVRAALKASNVFVQRHVAYQFRRGENGFSAVAFKTEDAEADHERFRRTGLSAGPLLEFSRDFESPDGSKAKATFRLAFAADPRAPDCLFFTCQRLNFPAIERSHLEHHANGAVSIRSIVLGAPEVATFVRYLEGAAGGNPRESGIIAHPREGIVTIQHGATAFEFMDNRAIARDLQESSNEDRGLQARAVVFGVDSYNDTERYLSSKGVGFTTAHKRIIVPPAYGQGAIFVFESNHDQT